MINIILIIFYGEKYIKLKFNGEDYFVKKLINKINLLLLKY